ncbi:hypothetical protein GQ53DRAFT_830312 [Thozetella sp. PMI_491]|nr:hypothetical protein GQ53DRAFT_830312 [Thozetella sp. PMI_491]
MASQELNNDVDSRQMKAVPAVRLKIRRPYRDINEMHPHVSETEKPKGPSLLASGTAAPANMSPPEHGSEPFPIPPEQYSRPSPAAGPGPVPQYQVPGQNIGMLAGGVMGAAGGDGMVGGMVVGGVVGGLAGQRLAQAEKSAYWRGQAAEYRAGLAAGQPPQSQQAQEQAGGSGEPKKPSWWSREAREQRRLKRWERRAKRRDGTVLGGSKT